MLALTAGVLASRPETRMAISVVNGYVCTSSCDVAKARKGEDPHPRTGVDQADAAKDKASRADDPAVLFGGTLADLRATRDITEPEATQHDSNARKPVLDRLV
jgi:hypothetical protein